MSDTETLETSQDGRFRVRLVLDEYPDEPYDDGQSPLMRLDTSGMNGVRAEHLMATGRPLDDDSRIEEAAERWAGPSDDDWRYFEKYLRAYYGATRIETWYSGDYWYVTYDTARWREYIGVPASKAESWLADHSDSINMNEYQAWVEGDCWYYVVEQNVTWRREDDPDTTMETWETVDSCGGFYGDEWARECALEAFRDATEPKFEPVLSPDRIAAAVADMERVQRNREADRAAGREV